MQPTFTEPLPKKLTLTQFIQTILTGVSALDGTLVRPSWQPNPPNQPDGNTDWMAFGIATSTPDFNAFIGTALNGVTSMQRHEVLEISCSVYGPNAIEIASLIRDGFQIPQNLDALKLANMGYREISPARHVPDLVNERFIDRMMFSVFIKREIQRTYPIVSILSAKGTIHTVLGDEQYLLNWQTPT